jgi:preprotein translocase subunit YajC
MPIVIYFAVIAALFFVLIVRPQRRQVAARKALIGALAVGDDVITAGGIYGTIVEMDDDVLLVRVADGVELRIAREAIARRRVDEPASVDVDLAAAADTAAADTAADDTAADGRTAASDPAPNADAATED